MPEIVPRCWSDLAPVTDNLSGRVMMVVECQQPADGRLGLCQKHALQILGPIETEQQKEEINP